MNKASGGTQEEMDGLSVNGRAPLSRTCRPRGPRPIDQCL